MNPAGIQVNELLTERSHRPRNEGESSADEAAYEAMEAQKESYSEDDEFANNSEYVGALSEEHKLGVN